MCADYLRSDGIVGMDVLKIISNLMFFSIVSKDALISKKLMSELIEDLGKEDAIKVVQWSNLDYLISCPSEKSLDYFNDVWEFILSRSDITKSMFSPGEKIGIQSCKTFRNVIETIKRSGLTEKRDDDMVGEAYQHFISKEINQGILGQHFTNHSITSQILKEVDPGYDEYGNVESVFDPASGTSGFLLEAARHFNNKGVKKSRYIDEIQGREINKNTARLGRLNMILIGGEVDNIECGDSIRKRITKKYDCVVANPPFGVNIEFNAMSENARINIPVKTSSAVSMFIQVIVNILKPSGRAGFVLPIGKEIWGASEMKMRKWLFENVEVYKIVELPENSFEYAKSLLTCILYLRRKKNPNQEYVEFVDKNGTSERVSMDRILKHGYSLYLTDYRSEVDSLFTLDRLCDSNTESVPSGYFKEYGKIINYITIRGIEKLVVGRDKIPSRARRIVREGDTIISTVRPNLRNVKLITSDCDGFVCTTGYCVLRPKEKIPPELVYYIARLQQTTDYLVSRARGATYPCVSAKDIMALPLLDLSAHKITQLSKTIKDMVAIREEREEKIKRLQTKIDILKNKNNDEMLRFGEDVVKNNN